VSGETIARWKEKRRDRQRPATGAAQAAAAISRP